jgi:hypothetical protein
MKHKSLWAIGLVLAALLTFSGWGGKAQVPVRKTWEYKVVAQYGATPATLAEQEMNKLGAEGWELADTRVVTFQQGGSTQHRTDYHFKRAR